MIVYISQTYTDEAYIQLHIFSLKNTKGCPSWDRTTLKAIAKASVSRMKILEKSRRAKIEVFVIFLLSVVKVIFADVLHENLVKHNRSVSGVV